MARTARTPLHMHDAQRIALIKPSSLGDIVHALPVLTALRRRYPQAHLGWVVNAAYEPLLQGHPDLDRTIPFDRGTARQGLASIRRFALLLRRLRHERFDLVVDLQGLLRSGVMAAASGARRRLGLSTAREGAAWFYTDIVPVPGDPLHAVDRYWLVAQALGAGDGPKLFTLPQRPGEARWAEELLRHRPRPWLFLAPGARWETKRWPPAHFASLAQRALDCAGGTVVLIGGAEDQPLAQRLARLVRDSTLDLTGRTTLPQLVAALARADVIIANDTGPLHLAAALGRPVLAPYTCTRDELTGPYGQPGRAVEASIWCQGSLLKRCSRLECMVRLTPEHLWPLLREMLHSWKQTLRCA